MSSLARRWIGIGAILGAIGVALGAYSATACTTCWQSTDLPAKI